MNTEKIAQELMTIAKVLTAGSFEVGVESTSNKAFAVYAVPKSKDYIPLDDYVRVSKMIAKDAKRSGGKVVTDVMVASQDGKANLRVVVDAGTKKNRDALMDLMHEKFGYIHYG